MNTAATRMLLLVVPLAQAGADTINFHDPRPQAGVIRPPVRQLTAENADLIVVNVKDGTLLLFPAWLEHSVDPNRSQRPRIRDRKSVV